jgi:hypothetical protein
MTVLRLSVTPCTHEDEAVSSGLTLTSRVSERLARSCMCPQKVLLLGETTQTLKYVLATCAPFPLPNSVLHADLAVDPQSPNRDEKSGEEWADSSHASRSATKTRTATQSKLHARTPERRPDPAKKSALRPPRRHDHGLAGAADHTAFGGRGPCGESRRGFCMVAQLTSLPARSLARSRAAHSVRLRGASATCVDLGSAAQRAG